MNGKKCKLYRKLCKLDKASLVYVVKGANNQPLSLRTQKICTSSEFRDYKLYKRTGKGVVFAETRKDLTVIGV